MTANLRQVCVLGAGPRGLSVLERLCANARAQPPSPPLIVHMVDPSPPGAGAVWRTDQHRHLLMNTVASQITVYTDASTRIDGPIEPGPTLHEWARGLAREPGAAEEHDAETVAEAAELGPDTYPSIAFYGSYLRDAFRRIAVSAPEGVTVRVHRSAAVAAADTHGVAGGPQGVRLADGTRLHQLDAVVLALGHGPVRPSPPEAQTASLARVHGLRYVASGNPADAVLDDIAPGEHVLLRGLGLCFFDYLALFTTARGGVFERGAHGLAYRPSGREPKLFASSRRGVPYHARGENEKGASGRHLPRLLDARTVEELRARGGRVEFGADVWPLVAREVESVYYGALLAARGRAAERAHLVARYLALPPDAEEERPVLLAAYGIGEEDRWDWERLARPYGGRRFRDRADFRDWLRGHLAEDVRAARSGNVTGPLKAALDVLRDIRNEVRLAVDHGGLDGRSYRDELSGWYTPFNAFLSIGPPAERIEQLLALVDAGLVELTGPGTEIRIDPENPAFVCASRTVPGPPVRARVLIEARLPETDLRRTADPLLRHLMETAQCTTYRIPARDGSGHDTGGLAVTRRPYRVVDGGGHAHPRRFAFGVPTEGVHWVTAAGTRPGVDSVTLGDSDALAREVLSLPPALEPGERSTEPAERTGVLV